MNDPNHCMIQTVKFLKKDLTSIEEDISKLKTDNSDVVNFKVAILKKQREDLIGKIKKLEQEISPDILA